MKYVILENYKSYGEAIKREVCASLQRIGYSVISVGRNVNYCDYWYPLIDEGSNNHNDLDKDLLKYECEGTFRRYHLDLNDKDDIDNKYNELMDKYIVNYLTIKKLISEIKDAEFTVVWGGLLLESRSVRKASHELNIKTFALEFSFDKDRIYFDLNGIVGNQHEFSAPVEYDLINGDKLNHIKGWVESCEHTKSFQGDKNSDLAAALQVISSEKVNLLLLCQCNIDTVITYDNPFFETTTCAYKAIFQAIDKSSLDVNLIVKLHPGDKQKYKEEIYSLSKEYSFVSVVGIERDINVYALMSVCEFGVTINSQSGLEMLAHGKNVLTLGNSFYAEQGFGIKHKRGEKLASNIKKLINTPLTAQDIHRIHSYLYAFLYKNLIPKYEGIDVAIKRKLGIGRKLQHPKLLIVHPSGSNHGSAFYLQELAENLKRNGVECLILAEGSCPIVEHNGTRWLKLAFQDGLLSQNIKKIVSEFSPSHILQVGVRHLPMRAALELHVSTNAPIIVQAEDDEDAALHRFYPDANIDSVHIFDSKEINSGNIIEFVKTLNVEETIEMWKNPTHNRWVEPVLRNILYRMAIFHTCIWYSMAERLKNKFNKPTMLIPPIINLSDYKDFTCSESDKVVLLNKYKIPLDSFIIFVNGTIYSYSDEFETFILGVKEAFKFSLKKISVVVSGKVNSQVGGLVRSNLRGCVYFRSMASPDDLEYNRMIKIADLICAPGHNDSFNKYRMSSRLVKAIAMGKPILTYKTGFAENLYDFKHGYFAYTNQPSEWAFLILIAMNTSLSKRIGLECGNFCASEFSAELVASRFANVLKMLNGHSRPNKIKIESSISASQKTSKITECSEKYISDFPQHAVYKKICNKGLSSLSHEEVDILVRYAKEYMSEFSSEAIKSVFDLRERSENLGEAQDYKVVH